MPWEALLDKIRQGEIQIADLTEGGVPRMAANAPHYELMQFVAALVAGYNRNFSKIKSLRNFVKTIQEGADVSL